MHFVEYSKYLLVAALAYFDFATYAGLTTLDVGSRAVYAATYVGMSRLRLQLPTAAFVPPPRLFAATDVVLYVAPAAVASGVDALHHVPKVLRTVHYVINRAATALVAYHDRLLIAYRNRPALTPSLTMPRVLMVGRLAYMPMRQLWYDDLSLALPAPVYPNFTYPTFNLPLPSPPPIILTLPVCHYLSPPVEHPVPELSPLDRQSPKSAIVQLGQCTPYRVLDALQGPIYLDWDIDETAEILSYIEPTSEGLDRSKEIIIYVLSHANDLPETEETVIVDDTLKCLAIIFVILLLFGYIVFRIIVCLVKWTYGYIFEMYLILGAIFQMGSRASGPSPMIFDLIPTHHPDLVPIPTPPSPIIPMANIDAPPPQESPPPSATASIASPSRPVQKDETADLGETTTVDPAHVPLPPNQDENWVALPTTAPLPLFPPASPLSDMEIPPLSLPPPTPTSDVQSPPLLDDKTWSNPTSTQFLPKDPPGLASSPRSAVAASDISPDEIIQGNDRSGAGQPSNSTSEANILDNCGSKVAGGSLSTAGEPEPNDGGGWKIVERRCRPRRVLSPAPEPPSEAGTSRKKTRRGARGGKGKQKEAAAA